MITVFWTYEELFYETGVETLEEAYAKVSELADDGVVHVEIRLSSI